MNKTKTLAIGLLASLITLSCTTETYDSGDGDYSYLRADFVELQISKAQQSTHAICDDGTRISFNEPLKVTWAEQSDTLYRALLYYNSLPSHIEALNVGRVYVLWPKVADKVKNLKNDPVKLESMWMSKCCRELKSDGETVSHYLNLAFLVKTGHQDDDQALQSIGMMKLQNDDGSLQLTLLHDQGTIPEYYSARVYVSIPLTETQAKNPITLTVNTYDGIITKRFE